MSFTFNSNFTVIIKQSGLPEVLQNTVGHFVENAVINKNV